MSVVRLAQLCLNLSGIPKEPARLSDVFGRVKNNIEEKIKAFQF